MMDTQRQHDHGDHVKIFDVTHNGHRVPTPYELLQHIPPEQDELFREFTDNLRRRLLAASENFNLSPVLELLTEYETKIKELRPDPAPDPAPGHRLVALPDAVRTTLPEEWLTPFDNDVAEATESDLPRKLDQWKRAALKLQALRVGDEGLDRVHDLLRQRDEILARSTDAQKALALHLEAVDGAA
ncbi:hypothetical protein AB0O47_39460 [Streptomyces noursei]|uniref:hypothetical protein n=1 Tax=Streptomyces noursei TaxID=1971 RepID=UPI00344C359D